MNIKKQDYLDLGIDEEVLNFVDCDDDGFVRHPIHQQIGPADFSNTLYFLVAKKLGYKPMIDNADLDEYEDNLNPAVISWFNSKKDDSHIWNKIVDI